MTTLTKWDVFWGFKRIYFQPCGNHVNSSGTRVVGSVKFLPCTKDILNLINNYCTKKWCVVLWKQRIPWMTGPRKKLTTARVSAAPCIFPYRSSRELSWNWALLIMTEGKEMWELHLKEDAMKFWKPLHRCFYRALTDRCVNSVSHAWISFNLFILPSKGLCFDIWCRHFHELN